MSRGFLLLIVALGALGLVLGGATSSFGGSGSVALTIPSNKPSPPAGGPGSPCTLPGQTPIQQTTGVPELTAGESFHEASCGWFPRTSCTNRVRFTLKIGNHSYDLGALRPEEYVVGFLTATLTSPVTGTLTIPEAANVGRSPVQGTISGGQILDFGFPVVGCIDLVKRAGAPRPVLIRPAASDGSVISLAQPVEGKAVPQGTSLSVQWTLSRAGEVRIHVYYELTPGRELSVSPGAQDAVVDRQAPVGASQASVPLADAAGHSFPLGTYRVEVQLLDPPSSGLVSATPKSAHFQVVAG